MSASAAAPRPTSTPVGPSGWYGTLVNGTSSVVSGPRGNVWPGTANGLYADGRRLLDRFELTVGVGELVTTGNETVGAEARYALTAEAGPGQPPVEVERRRTLGAGPDTASGALLTDRITLTSRAPYAVATWVRVVVAGDGLDTGAVRRAAVDGEPTRAGSPSARVTDRQHVVVLDDARHLVRVSQHPQPLKLSAHDGAAVLESDVVLHPGEPVTLVVTLTAERHLESGFVATPGPAGVDWEAVGIAADDHGLVTAVGHGLDDLRHLLVRDPLEPNDVVAVSAAPWDQTLDAREALWAARLTLSLGVDLALGTLRALARRQVHLPQSEAPSEPPAHDVAEVTTLWVCLLGEARLWGLADHRVRELLPTLELAVAWIRGQIDGGFLVDLPRTPVADVVSTPAVVGGGGARFRWREEEQPGPVVRLEVQTGAVEALRVAARIYDDLRVDGALELEAEAMALADRVREHFWSTHTDGRQQLAAALDAEGRPLDGDCSSVALSLGTGALSEDESRLVVESLMDEALSDPLGVKVRGTDVVRPDKTGLVAWSLVRSGFLEQGAAMARSLVDASQAFGHQWPESFVTGGRGQAPEMVAGAARPTAVSAAASAVVLQAVLGLTVDAPAGWVRVHPPVSAPFGKVDVTGVRFQGHPFRVTVGAGGRVDVQGLPSDVDLDLPHGA